MTLISPPPFPSPSPTHNTLSGYRLRGIRLSRLGFILHSSAIEWAPNGPQLNAFTAVRLNSSFYMNLRVCAGCAMTMCVWPNDDFLLQLTYELSSQYIVYI